MATTYFITPYDPILWKDEYSLGGTSTLVIDFQNFSQAAKLKWPSYESYPYFSWSISFDDDSEVSGGFSGQGNQILALDKPVSAIHFNQFVVWYRSYIASEHKLFLFVEGSWDSLELTNETTENEVGQFIGIN